MGLVLNTGAIAQKKNVTIDQRIQLIFSDRLSEAQIKSGIQAKVTIVHPCFTTRATVFKAENGTLRVMGSSMQLEDKDWFNIVLLEPAFRDHVLAQYKEFKEGKTARGAWYLELKGDKVTHVDDEPKNETIDLEEIILNANLSDKQSETGMVAKVSIKTPIATLRGVSVFQSRYGQSLYLIEQSENAQNNIPAYSLSRECEAQVLNYIHSLVTEWGAPPEQKAKNTPPANAAQTAVEGAGAPANDINEEQYYK